MANLCVNIDHVATVRQARRTYEPDPILAAGAACKGGADGITVHLREDRRHVQDADVEALSRIPELNLNLEMAPTDEMVGIACRIRPQMVMLVPEGRLEVTTEGGLDVIGERAKVDSAVGRLLEAGLKVSIFIDADHDQIRAAAAVGASVCEVHTGPYAEAVYGEASDAGRSGAGAAQLARVSEAGALIRDLGMAFNAGHAVNYENVSDLAALPGLGELHIGHSIVSRSVFVGMESAVREMKQLIDAASGVP
ncbi:MAG: pyridoxine 5'-phosphate synthase [Planctomycetota bacterium]|nr:pyridoxine 5'-phosphate synthase [Planctomycetota bacterium]